MPGMVEWRQLPDQWITYANTITTNTAYTWRWNETSSSTLINNCWASSNTTTGGWTTLTYNGAALTYLQPDEEIGRATAEIEAAAEQVARQRQDRANARAVAVERGEQLLLSLLDEAQQASYRMDGEFMVIGSAGTVYRIKRGTSGNIEWITPDGGVGGRLCAHPTMHHEWIPTADVMAAQLLALMTDEASFVRVANVQWGSRPPRVEEAAA